MDQIIARVLRSRQCVHVQVTERYGDLRGARMTVRPERNKEDPMSAIKTSAKQFKYVMGAMTAVFFATCSAS
ncbi:hypothetical protein GCM10010343_28120 [Streptomyces avidinii]|nr:hypothetical protein GCM10010343_28120 [Streptomyces avidinii]